MGSRLGVIKIAAKRVGVSFETYQAKCASGLKFCWGCRRWVLKSQFNIDNSRGDGRSSKCIDCSRVKVKKTRAGRRAPNKSAQQRASDAVRHAIKRGLLDPPKSKLCYDCGMKARIYHHHLGYEDEHLLDVIALCDKCHHNRHWNGEPHDD